MNSVFCQKTWGRLGYRIQHSEMKLITKEPKNLLNATKEERQLFVDAFDYVLTDCDGALIIH